MKIAIPTADGKLAMHFGHCEQFAIIDVNDETKEIISEDYLTPPPHEPGVLPKWLADQGANCIISGGMGGRAQSLFTNNNIQVITGAASGIPRDLVKDFLDNKLLTGDNLCDH